MFTGKIAAETKSTMDESVVLRCSLSPKKVDINSRNGKESMVEVSTTASKSKAPQGLRISTPTSLDRDCKVLTTYPFSPVAPFSPSTDNPQNIRVIARIRPLSAQENARGCQSRVHAITRTPSFLNSEVDEENIDPGKAIGKVTTTENNCSYPDSLIVDSPTADGGRVFDYDAVLDCSTTQTQVYDNTVGDAIRNTVFLGYNCTILAYGQTGSGKTFTMIGNEASSNDDSINDESGKKNDASAARRRKRNKEKVSTYELSHDDGIIPRVMFELFKAREECSGDVDVSLTFLELYNDEIRDLLSDAVSYSSAMLVLCSFLC